MGQKKNFVVLEKGIPMVCLPLQHLVDLSNFLLKIHSAMLYGLITGPDINQSRCIKYIEMGKRQGITPNDDYVPADDFFEHYVTIDEIKKEEQP